MCIYIYKEKFPNKIQKHLGINLIRILGTYMKETINLFLSHKRRFEYMKIIPWLHCKKTEHYVKYT